MPWKKPHGCSLRGCPALTSAGRYCKEHEPKEAAIDVDWRKAIDAERGSAAARGYGHRWRKLRLIKLRMDPMCQAEGCGQVATDVDHIMPKRVGGSDDMDNLQSLCHACHSRKTVSEMRLASGVPSR